MRTLYTAVSTAHGGRDGHVRSSDGVVDLDLKTPKETGGPGGAGTNPEQLFAAGYPACFESARPIGLHRHGEEDRETPAWGPTASRQSSECFATWSRISTATCWNGLPLGSASTMSVANDLCTLRLVRGCARPR